MARIVLAPALARWLAPGTASSGTGGATTTAVGGEVVLEAGGRTLGEALDGVFERHPELRGYVLDEQGAVRHHVALFVDGEVVHGKRLDRALGAHSEVHVMQALSGG